MKSATNVAVHLLSSISPSLISSVLSKSSDPGLIFHIRTCPSRPPVATRWYERPHEGAHDTEVTAEAPLVLMMLELDGVELEGFAVGGSVDDGGLKDELIPDEVGGDGLRVRSVDERRAFNCIIWKRISKNVG